MYIITVFERKSTKLVGRFNLRTINQFDLMEQLYPVSQYRMDITSTISI
jgi:hypothetical protein